MSVLALVFWLWISMNVGFLLGWILRSIMGPRERITHTTQKDRR